MESTSERVLPADRDGSERVVRLPWATPLLIVSSVAGSEQKFGQTFDATFTFGTQVGSIS